MTVADPSAGWLAPITLQGRHVMLEPLQSTHADALGRAADDGERWKLWYTSVPSADQVDAYIGTALQQQRDGSASPFAVRDDTVVFSILNSEWPTVRCGIDFRLAQGD